MHWRWPAGTARRRWSPPRRRARASLRLHPGRHPQPFRAEYWGGSRGCRRRSRRLCRRRRATGRPRRGQRHRVRQQRLARSLRGGGPARPATGRRRCARSSTRARRARPRRRGVDLHWTGPWWQGTRFGRRVLVSNNRYRLGQPLGSGTRPKIDGGELGIAVMSAPGRAAGAGPLLPRTPWEEWSAPRFEVDSDPPVPAGIDGEAVQTRPAASLLDPSPGAEGADRPGAPGRVAVGHCAGAPLTGARGAAANRRRPTSAERRLGDDDPRDGRQRLVVDVAPEAGGGEEEALDRRRDVDAAFSSPVSRSRTTS